MGTKKFPRTIAALATAAVLAGLVTAGPANAAPETIAAADPPSWSSMNTQFVTRDASQLMLDGAPFRFSGANLYWLGLDENVGGVDFPTFFRIRDALDTAKELGITVVRSHMMTSTGQADANPLALMPALGEYNDEAFATIDFAIAYAGSIGIRLILPLTDEWAYYHGGHRDFTTPLGLEPNDFYSDPQAIAAFQDYVDHILSRTNALTGVRYVDDPTVLAWELGNELENMTVDWITDQAAFIADRAPEQLIAAGRRFDIDPDTLAVPAIDIVDVHYYPPTVAAVSAHAATVTDAGKVYIAGEYGSNSASAELLEPLAANPDVTGMMLWSLFGHNDRGGFVPHDDGFTMHYPGTTEKMREQSDAIAAFSTAVGSTPGSVSLDAPLITEVVSTNGIKSVAWRGVAAAVSYRVERSTAGGDWTVVAEVPAEASPLLDTGSAGDVRYRVVALAPGKDAVVSDVVAAGAEASVIVDPLEDLRLVSSSSDVRIAAVGVHGAAVGSGDAPTLTWTAAGATEARFLLGAGSASDIEIASSADGVDWVEAAVTSHEESGRTALQATGLVGERVRIAWSAASGVELVRATLTAEAPRPALVDPLNDLSLTSAHVGALSVDTGNPALFGGDGGRVKRDSADAASLTWSFDDITGADLVAWYWPDQPVIPLVLRGSSDGQEWQTLEPQVSGGAGNWKRYDYRLRGLEGVDHLQVSWDGAQGEPWTPQLGSLTLYSPNAAPPAAPAGFSLTAPAEGASGITATPRLSWQAAAGAAYYRVTLARDAALEQVVEQSPPLTTPSYVPDAELAPGTVYYWSVEAINGSGTTRSAPAVASFRTAELPTEVASIDDFESYADAAALSAAYPRNPGGGSVAAALEVNPQTGTQAGSFSYGLTGPGYAGVIHTFPAPQNWWGYRGIAFDADAVVGQTLSVQFVAAGSYWEANVEVVPGWHHYELDFADFAPPSWAGEAELDLTQVTEQSFYLGGSGAGTLTVDDVRTTLTESLPAAPVNLLPPEISGTPRVGSTLHAEPGTWEGDPELDYRWQRDGVDIAGASGAEYTVVAADQGATVTVVVTATNAGGSVSVSSAGAVVLFDAELGLKLSTPLALSILKVKATVQLDTDAAVAGRTVVIHVGGKTVTATVDADGKATVTLPKLRTGLYAVQAEFAGDATVASAQSPRRLLLVLF